LLPALRPVNTMPSIGSAHLKLLESLCNAVAVCGEEGEVRRIVLHEVRPYAEDVRVDALGNVLAVRRGSGRQLPRLMLEAHMDEVGLMIVAEEGEGIYRFEMIGGIDARHLPGKQLIVGKQHVPGVIGAKPIHLTTDDERKHPIELESLRLDLGPQGEAQVGDRATFATRFRRAGGSVLAKAIDDRIGVATLIELFKHAPKHIDLCAAFTVQQEIGLRGAMVAAQHFEPDVAIAIDATPARDLPSQRGAENQTYNTKLGRGPAISMADKSMVYDPRLVRFLQQTAESEGIPYQIHQPGGADPGGTPPVLDGIRRIAVSVPHRYPHSPVSIARLDDWKNTMRLLEAALNRITRSV